MFDDVFPPAFRVGVAGGRGQGPQRIGRRRVGNQFVIVGCTGERDSQGQVDRPRLDVAFVGPGNRMPFGAEGRERREDRP